MAQRLRARGEELLRELSTTGDVVAKARSLIQESLAEGKATATAIARRAGLSPRVFARRLGAQGTSFRALLDEVRRARASELQRDARVSPGELAAALGFADVRSLQRAFQRWRPGTAPST